MIKFSFCTTYFQYLYSPVQHTHTILLKYSVYFTYPIHYYRRCALLDANSVRCGKWIWGLYGYDKTGDRAEIWWNSSLVSLLAYRCLKSHYIFYQVFRRPWHMWMNKVQTITFNVDSILYKGLWHIIKYINERSAPIFKMQCSI